MLRYNPRSKVTKSKMKSVDRPQHQVLLSSCFTYKVLVLEKRFVTMVRLSKALGINIQNFTMSP